MGVREERLMALLAQITSDSARRRGQEREERRRLAEFAVRLLVWDGESEELPDTPDLS